MRVVHVVGARPNFMKAAPVIAALREHGGVEQRLVHTGQHYDALLSDVFFAELDLPRPDVALGVGSGSHALQTARLLEGLEPALADLAPDVVVGYGDVTSTLAAALVCAKDGHRLAHVEAGLRSFDASMPEEVNRRVVDALSDVLLATSPEALGHLAREGVPGERVHLVGNPMIDTLLRVRDRLDPDAVRARLGLGDGPLGVVTLHRPGNVDDAAQTRRVVTALAAAAAHVPLLLPLHPRGRDRLHAAGLGDVDAVTVVDPLPYGEFVALVASAAVVVTDSGGVQEETTVLGVPCLTLRPNTERPVTISHGTNRLVTPEELGAAVARALADPPRPAEGPPLWDGRAGERVARVLVDDPRRRAPAGLPGA